MFNLIINDRIKLQYNLNARNRNFNNDIEQISMKT